MSNKIDERIVGMKFDNEKFEEGVKETTTTLGELKETLRMEGVASGVENIASKFNAFGAIVFGALQRITNAAIDAGLGMANAIIEPLVEGGKRRALAIEQAKFQFKGLGMDVEKTMEQALYAVKGTAFGLDEAAKAAANLGASQVPINQLGTSLRAISGVAALAGASYSDVADVFSNVAGQGRLMGNDLNRLAARGVNAAATLGKALGKTEGQVRKMVSKGQIDFKTFSRVMDQAFGEHATKASETFTGSLSNLRAALARIGAAFATPNFEAQRKMFNAITPAIDNIAAALGPVVEYFTELVNFNARNIVAFFNVLNIHKKDKLPAIFEALRNVFEFLISIAKPIKEAFTDIFPPKTAVQINTIAQAILKFTQNLKMGGKDSENLKNTFKGLFAIFDIGWMILKQVFGLFGRLFGVVSGGTGTILDFTGSLGSFIVSIRDAIKEGNGLASVFKWLGDTLEKPLRLIGKFGEATLDFVNVDNWGKAWQSVGEALRVVGEYLQPVFKWIGEAFQNTKANVIAFFKSLDFNILVGFLNLGVLTGVAIGIKKIFGMIKGVFTGDFTGGLGDKVRDIFQPVTDTFAAMQAKLKADALTKIAIAIGILTAAVIALSFVDTDKLFIALGAMTIMFGQLSAMLLVMDKFLTTVKVGKIVGMAGAMILMASAMVIFSSATLIMSTMDWNELARGLTGMGVGLGIMIGALALVSKIPFAKMIIGAGTLLTMATALVILASALKIFSSMGWDDFGKGMAVMSSSIAILAGGMALMRSSLLGATSMVIIAGALTVLAGALKIMATMSWDDIGRGLTVLAGSIGILVASLALMKSSVLGAASMVIVASAITILTGALKIMATMSWDDIGRTAVVLAGSLLILAGAMALMGIPIVLLGALGILAAAGAMAVLAPMLVLLGTMSWDAIGRGLTMLGSALAILAVGGVLLIPAIPAFLGLGAAALLIGTGTLAAGVGMGLMAVGLVALAGAAAVGSEAIKMALIAIISIIPAAMSAFAQGIIDFAVVIAKGGVEFTAAMVTLLTSLIEAIHTVGPMIINTLWDLLMQMAAKLEENVPILVDKGMKLIIGILDGIQKNIGKLVDKGGDVIIKFIDGLAKKWPDVINSASNLVVKFVDGIGTAVQKNSSKFVSAGSKLFRAIVDGVSRAIERGGSDIRWAGERIGNALLQGAKNALGIKSPSRKFSDEVMPSVFDGVEKGGDKGNKRAANVGTAIGDTMLHAVKKSISKMASDVNMDLDMSPTIRPVLDLSEVKKDATLIGSMLTPPTLTVEDSHASAANASSMFRANQEGSDPESNSSTAARSVSFTQYNYSPKALSQAEIYRRTRNQLSEAKKELTTTDA